MGKRFSIQLADLDSVVILRRLTLVTFLGLALSNTYAVNDWVKLESPNLSNSAVGLTFQGEPGVAYVVETSTNLQTWTAIATNNGAQITRTVDLDSANAGGFFRTMRKPLPIFSGLLTTISNIDFGGYYAAADSFDSADPNHSINGQYPFGQPGMVMSNADLAAKLSVTNSVARGSQYINGKIRTAPGGTVDLGTNGFATGGIYDDFNVVFPDVVLPTTSWISPTYFNEPGTNINGYGYNYVFNNDGDYTIPGDFSNGILVNTNAHVRLKITSSVQIMNMSFDLIRIAPGGRLTIYMLGTQFKVAGQGIVNDSGNTGDFTLFGLPSCTSIQFNSNKDFTGSIYAPQAAFSVGGGGTNIIDFIGASVTKSLRLNGHFNFHFDENLRRVGPTR